VNITTHAAAAIVAFPAVAITLFVFLPLRRAILGSFLLGWLFLPQGRLDLPSVLPDTDKGVAIAFGVLLSLSVFDTRRLLSFRPSWVDLPVVVLCAVGFFTSIDNGLGAYDGLSAVLARTLQFGPMWLLGRIYFSDREGLRALALALVIGGLLYVPVCMIEMRLSPQLHRWVWGYHQHSFLQTIRLGGYRPMGFLQHGLALGMWMTCATLLGAWMYLSGDLRRTAWLLLLPGLALTTLLCRSIGALLLLGAGLALLFASRASGRATLVALVLLVAPAYSLTRATGLWSGATAIEMAGRYLPADRVQSFTFRLDNETILADKAMQRPLLGWGGWGRSQVKDRRGEEVSVTDGWWIIVFGQNGVVGLVAFLALSALPVGLFLWRVPARTWSRPWVAPAAGLAVLCALYTLDNLMNAMLNPLHIMALGGLAGLGVDRRRAVDLVRAPRRGHMSPVCVGRSPPAPSEALTISRSSCAPRNGPRVALKTPHQEDCT
jgi:hypothetical protein